MASYLRRDRARQARYTYDEEDELDDKLNVRYIVSPESGLRSQYSPSKYRVQPNRSCSKLIWQFVFICMLGTIVCQQLLLSPSFNPYGVRKIFENSYSGPSSEQTTRRHVRGGVPRVPKLAAGGSKDHGSGLASGEGSRAAVHHSSSSSTARDQGLVRSPKHPNLRPHPKTVNPHQKDLHADETSEYHQSQHQDQVQQHDASSIDGSVLTNQNTDRESTNERNSMQAAQVDVILVPTMMDTKAQDETISYLSSETSKTTVAVPSEKGMSDDMKSMKREWEHATIANNRISHDNSETSAQDISGSIEETASAGSLDNTRLDNDSLDHSDSLDHDQQGTGDSGDISSMSGKSPAGSNGYELKQADDPTEAEIRKPAEDQTADTSTTPTITITTTTNTAEDADNNYQTDLSSSQRQNDNSEEAETEGGSIDAENKSADAITSISESLSPTSLSPTSLSPTSLSETASSNTDSRSEGSNAGTESGVEKEQGGDQGGEEEGGGKEEHTTESEAEVREEKETKSIANISKTAERRSEKAKGAAVGSSKKGPKAEDLLGTLQGYVNLSKTLTSEDEETSAGIVQALEASGGSLDAATLPDDESFQGREGEEEEEEDQHHDEEVEKKEEEEEGSRHGSRLEDAEDQHQGSTNGLEKGSKEGVEEKDKVQASDPALFAIVEKQITQLQKLVEQGDVDTSHEKGEAFIPAGAGSKHPHPARSHQTTEQGTFDATHKRGEERQHQQHQRVTDEKEGGSSQEEASGHLNYRKSARLGWLREVTETLKPDRTVLDRMLAPCSVPAKAKDDEVEAWPHRLQPINNWPLPAPSVTHHDGYLHHFTQVSSKDGTKAAPAEFTQGAVGRWKQCALVGNSAVLLKANFGNALDEKFDTIVRLNGAPLVGYEEYVGTKTSIRFLNPLWTQAYASKLTVRKHNLPLEKNVSLMVAESRPVDPAMKLSESMADQRPDTIVLAQGPHWAGAAKQSLGMYRQCLKRAGRTFHGGETPSHGFLAVYSLMHACHHLTVFGFSSKFKPNAGGKEDVSLYYTGFGSDIKEGSSQNALQLEQVFMKALAADNRITLCGAHGCRRGRTFLREPLTEPP